MASSLRSSLPGLARGAALALALALAVPPRAARAQSGVGADTVEQSSDVAAGVRAGERRRVEGQILKPGSNSMLSVVGATVTLHRVGADAAGPIDSMRTGRDGRFGFRYVTSGQGSAVYFVSVSYGGIAYLSPPLKSASVTGPEADVTVFDTTSAAVPLSVRGRHLVVEAADSVGLRRVTEVFDLSNDTTLTAVAPAERAGRPTFAAPLPPGARAVQVRDGDVSADAVVVAGGEVRVFAPFSPGIKQVAYSYQLPNESFPLTMPVARPTSVLEVLVEEAGASVTGARLVAVTPAPLSGRNFRRFLAQDVPASGVATLSVAPPPGGKRNVALIVVAAAALAGLLALVANRLARRTAPVPVPVAAGPSPELLARRIADLDARFERSGDASDAARAAYAAERGELKAALQSLLARRTGRA